MADSSGTEFDDILPDGTDGEDITGESPIPELDAPGLTGDGFPGEGSSDDFPSTPDAEDAPFGLAKGLSDDDEDAGFRRSRDEDDGSDDLDDDTDAEEDHEDDGDDDSSEFGIDSFREEFGLAGSPSSDDEPEEEPEDDDEIVTASVESEDEDEESSSPDEETDHSGRPSPSDYTTRVDTKTVGSKHDDQVFGDDGVDIVKAKKGDDEVDGAGGDDWLRGGHGDDTLEGGAGEDVVDGEKGDDRLIYTMADNEGVNDYYDGGKGSDTLVLRLTADEFETYKDEIAELESWIADNANEKASSGHAFNDASAKGGSHPVFETSFGLSVRNFEAIEVEVADAPEPAPEPEPEPELVPEPTPEPDPEPGVVEEIKVDLGATTGETVPVEVKLAPDSTVTLSVDVDVTELPPKFDVFMVQDLSGSFYDDLPNVKDQFPTLIEGLSAEYDAAFGVGSFVDKPVEPFGWSYTDYVYKTHQAITSDAATATSSMESLTTYSGWDWPESQLEALVQVALRGDEIGFRDGTQKFVVLSTDAPYHMAGDYAEAGPNDLDTELENEDYPDPADVDALLEAAGIIPVFAVISSELATYQALVDDWGYGSVTELASDSSNILDAITGGLKEASLDLTLDISGDDYGYVAGMTPEVYEDAGPGTYTFDISLEIPADADSYESDSLTLSIPGYGDISLDVEIASVDMAGDESAETLMGDAGPNAIYGEGGSDTLDGEGGSDTLDGGTGADTLTGGLGDDVFVFEDGDGSDVITDFDAGGVEDSIDLRRVSSVSTYSDVIAAASQVGEDTILDFGGGDSITLLGVNIDDLSEQDVLV